jgi:hypothetical protein
LHLGKLSETVIVHGNAPHNRPRFLVSHLISKPCELPLHESANAQGPRQSFWMASDQRVFMRHLRGLRVSRRPLGRDVSEGASSAGLAWLDRLPIILSVNAWSVVAASLHSRASLRYSSRCRVSSVSSAALTQFSAWYS